jgi:hypothetical protein
MDENNHLKALCDAAVSAPEFQPKDGVTHCNQAVRSIALGMGYTGFAPDELATHMIGFMAASPDWEAVNMEHAAQFAQAGRMVVACMVEQSHGHVAVLYPAPMQQSGSLGYEVPMIANVGKTNGVMRASQAFPVAQFPRWPIYYALKAAQ